MTRKTMRSRLEARLIAEGRLPPKKEPTAKNGKDRLFALGRMKVGEKNQTEQRFEDEYLRPLLLAGEISWYRFEGIKLRLADNTFLTVDYAVLPAGGVLTMIDVKGGAAVVQEDARVKMRVAADQYPFLFQYAFPAKGGGWTIKDV
ncbi:hypothetical protein [Sphingobium sp.]|uniref:hypothetical protein n=1 Tax=Sphingobium sp. TaxID=1912891 RepID=UPI00257E4C3A|nr:hypothetical protein [Sphingobium sp.]